MSRKNKEVKVFSILYIFFVLCLLSSRSESAITLNFLFQSFSLYGCHIAILHIELKFQYMGISYSKDPTIQLFQINNFETQK